MISTLINWRIKKVSYFNTSQHYSEYNSFKLRKPQLDILKY